MKMNKNQTCTDFDLEIDLYLNNDLPIDRIDFWRNHLSNCAECSKGLAQRTKILKQVKESLSADLLEIEFDHMINAAIKNRRNKLSGITERLRSKIETRSFRIKFAVMTGVAVIAIVLVLMVNVPFRERSSENIFSDTSTNKTIVDEKNIDRQVEMIFGREMDRSMDEIEMQLQRIKNDFHQGIQN